MVSSNRSDKKQLLKRLSISHADIQFALSAITFFNEFDLDARYNLVELRRIKCFELSFVIAYARAFSNNKGKYKSLSLDKIGVKLSAAEKKLHKIIINTRNTIYAHSDESFQNNRTDFFEIDIKGQMLPIVRTQFEHGMYFIEQIEIMAIMELMHKILFGIYETSAKLASELKDEMPLVMTPIDQLPT